MGGGGGGHQLWIGKLKILFKICPFFLVILFWVLFWGILFWVLLWVKQLLKGLFLVLFKMVFSLSNFFELLFWVILLFKVLFWVNVLFWVIFWGIFWVNLLFWALFWVTLFELDALLGTFTFLSTFKSPFFCHLLFWGLLKVLFFYFFRLKTFMKHHDGSRRCGWSDFSLLFTRICHQGTNPCEQKWEIWPSTSTGTMVFCWSCKQSERERQNKQPTAFSVLIRFWSTHQNLFSPRNGREISSSVFGTTRLGQL